MRSNGLLTSLTGSLMLVAAPASAVVIAEYSFDSNSQASTDASLETDALDATFGAWDGASPGSDIGFSSEAAFARSSATSAVLSDGTTGAIDDDDYLSFTIQGSGFDVTSISFSHAMTDTNNGNTYQAHLFTSATGFAAGDVLGSSTLLGNGGAVTGGLTFDANAVLALQGLAADLEVRIYLTDTQNVPGFVHFVDNIVVEGTPEPSSLAVLGFAGACLFWHRRRA